MSERQELAIERLRAFATEWNIMKARGHRDNFIYELHPGDPRHAVCRLDDILELLELVA